MRKYPKSEPAYETRTRRVLFSFLYATAVTAIFTLICPAILVAIVIVYARFVIDKSVDIECRLSDGVCVETSSLRIAKNPSPQAEGFEEERRGYPYNSPRTYQVLEAPVKQEIRGRFLIRRSGKLARLLTGSRHLVRKSSSDETPVYVVKLPRSRLLAHQESVLDHNFRVARNPQRRL
jgi:hypothetical protein